MNDAIGICPQGNVDFGMSFFEDGKERGQNSRRRPIGSTHPQWAGWFLRGAVEIAVIDLIELGQDRLDIPEKLMTLVCQFDPLRMSNKKAKLKIIFQGFQMFGRGRLRAAYWQPWLHSDASLPLQKR